MRNLRIMLGSTLSRHRQESTEGAHKTQMRPVNSVLGGICLDDEMLDFIPKLLKTSRSCLEAGNEVEGVKIFSAGIFVANRDTKVVFKIENDQKGIKERWECVEKAAEVCKDKNLNLLVLPRQSLFNLPDGSLLIAEERLPLTNDWLRQEEFYSSFASDLTAAIKQLATFIIWSGFHNVDFRNIPVLDLESHASGSSRRIALVDVENLGTPFLGTDISDYWGNIAKGNTLEYGLFGIPRRIAGLFGCILPTQFDSVCEAALQTGINLEGVFPGAVRSTHKQRIKEIDKRKRLAEVARDATMFDDFARKIIELPSQDVNHEATEIVKIPIQSVGPRLNLAARAFRHGDSSGLIFADDTGEIVAFIVHLVPDPAEEPDILNSALGVEGTVDYVESTREDGELRLFRTSLRESGDEFRYLLSNFEHHRLYSATLDTTSKP